MSESQPSAGSIFYHDIVERHRKVRSLIERLESLAQIGQESGSLQHEPCHLDPVVFDEVPLFNHGVS